MKMILHKFLTTLVLALLTLVLQANAFFPQGRANTKPSNNRRLIGGSASKVIRKRESKQLAHLLFSDKTNAKGDYLFRPWVYPAVDVGVQFIMMYLATKMTGFPKVYLGGLLCIHLGLIFVSDYGCEGKLAKKLLVGYLHRPLLRIKNWMLNFDKILLSSFFVCSIVFNKHTPTPSWMPDGSMPNWVTMVSLAASFASFWAIPRLDKDPSTSITFGIGKHRYQL